MPNIYTGSVQYTAVVQWAATTAYVSTSNGGRGDYRRQLAAPAAGSERVFRCTTSGTSLAAEPTWVTTKNGVTTESGGPVWTECTGQEADQTAALWKAPHSHLENAFAATWGAAGDTFFIAHDDAETRAAARTLTSPGTLANPCKVLCVNATTGSSMPPLSADLRTTAAIVTTGASSITLAGYVSEPNGVIISAGTGATNAALVCNGGWSFKNCALKKLGTTGSVIAIQLSFGPGVTIENTTLTFGSTGDGIHPSGTLTWRNTPDILLGGSVPTTLFANYGPDGGLFYFENVGLQSLGTNTFVGAITNTLKPFTLKNCKVASGFIYQDSSSYCVTHVINTDSAGTNYMNSKYARFGNQVPSTIVVRTGGASNGATAISANITANANAKWQYPIEGIQMAVWNGTTAANVTLTVEGLQDPRTKTTLPLNDEVWLELNYFGSATSPIGTANTGTKADTLATGSSMTASTEAWDSLVTARANSTVYALGAIRKVASNTGRVFICTTAGTSAGSEPAGYASAVDGGAVADNTATFTAAVRFKQSITLSAPQPAMAGYIYGTIKVGKASGIYYIDPKLVLS